jgi:hypothetical protein
VQDPKHKNEQHQKNTEIQTH